MTKAELIRVIIQLRDHTYTHDEMMRMTKKQLIDHFYRLADPTRFQERTEPYNPRYDEAYINEKIKKATKSWEGVDVDKFMDEMRGREVHSEALKEAAEEFAEGEWDGAAVDTDGNPLYAQDEIEYAFKAGAEWQKEQMMKEAFVDNYVVDDGRIELEGMPLPCLNPIILLPYPQFQPGDKVKLCVFPKEDFK